MACVFFTQAFKFLVLGSRRRAKAPGKVAAWARTFASGRKETPYIPSFGSAVELYFLTKAGKFMSCFPHLLWKLNEFCGGWVIKWAYMHVVCGLDTLRSLFPTPWKDQKDFNSAFQHGVTSNVDPQLYLKYIEHRLQDSSLIWSLFLKIDNFLALTSMQLIFKMIVFIDLCRLLFCSQVLLGKHKAKFRYEGHGLFLWGGETSKQPLFLPSGRVSCKSSGFVS